MKRSAIGAGATVLIGFCVCLEAAQADGDAPARNPSTALELPDAVVVGTTPLPGLGAPIDEIPANVQRITGSQLSLTPALNLADLLNQRLGSVNASDTQGNPFQPDVNFRGFSASPILGTPEGLSVFVDGVRVNEVFGDTVNWDLIPESAISNVTLIPGSNPIFGLNTLGGALSVQTKSGFENPGTGLSVEAGSFRRQDVGFETGGHGERIDYFVTTRSFDDHGTTAQSSSAIRQVFAKTGYQDATTDIDLSYTYSDAQLNGSQTLPVSWLDTPRDAYTWPDGQHDRLNFLNLKASRFLSDQLLLVAGLHDRRVTTSVANSNVNNNYDPTQPTGPGNEGTGNLFNVIHQDTTGGSVQASWLAPVAGHRNSLTIGTSFERGRTGFSQMIQEGGVSRDTASNQPISLQVRLDARENDTSAYLTDDFHLSEHANLTLSGRIDHAHAVLADQLGTALDGDHAYHRFDPSMGITINPSESLTAYASYSEGLRTPTPIELTCADPRAPCSLPNAFSADPALAAVVSRTIEAGARGTFARDSHWSAAAFRTEVSNDIEFISGGGSTSAGYFTNVGRTRRVGLELGADTRVGAWTVSGNLTLMSATYQSPFYESSPNNSTAAPLTCPACTDILVRPGDHLPGLPDLTGKLRVQWRPAARWFMGVTILGQTRSFARGDENNQDPRGPVPGFVIVNADARYRISKNCEAHLTISNLFDTRYSTFGTLGRNVFTGPGRTFDPTGSTWASEPFRSVGAPVGAWLGMTVHTD